MNISIIRYRLKEATNSIDGTLYIDGSRICDTAENAQFHIPVGTYAIEATKCQVQKRNIPVISLTSNPSPFVATARHAPLLLTRTRRQA